MRITINLASHPYVELRPIYTRLRLWMLVLAVLAVPLGWLLHIEKQRAAAATAHVRAMQTRVDQLQRQQQSYQTLMRQPQNAAVLDQSDFLNNLFRQKSFSWTATMTDLETVLPAGVQVQSIDPQMSPDGHVTIRMRVTGQRERALDLVKNLERSKHFASPRLAGEALATSSQGNQPMPVSASATDVNFDILADYRPFPGDEKAAAKQPVQQAQKGAEQ
ncbi:MAG TPA: fimbrial assembly protein [Pseudacidobacterium sp.]|nr:fimbrial assembly protein [Pseudacidobacterium sp.]